MGDRRQQWVGVLDFVYLMSNLFSDWLMRRTMTKALYVVVLEQTGGPLHQDSISQGLSLHQQQLELMITISLAPPTGSRLCMNAIKSWILRHRSLLYSHLTPPSPTRSHSRTMIAEYPPRMYASSWRNRAEFDDTKRAVNRNAKAASTSTITNGECKRVPGVSTNTAVTIPDPRQNAPLQVRIDL